MGRCVGNNLLRMNVLIFGFFGVLLTLIGGIGGATYITAHKEHQSPAPIATSTSITATTTTVIKKTVPTVTKKTVPAESTQPEMTPAEFQAMYQATYSPAPQRDYMQEILDRQAQEQQQLNDWAAQTRAPFDAYEAHRAQIDALKEQIRQEVAAAGGIVDESQLEVMAEARLKN